MSAKADHPARLQRTWFALDGSGTFLETTMGRRSFDEVVAGIVSGETPDVRFVYVAEDETFKIKTNPVVDEVFLQWRRKIERGANGYDYVPAFLLMHARSDVDNVLRSLRPDAERRAYHTDPDADHDAVFKAEAA